MHEGVDALLNQGAMGEVQVDIGAAGVHNGAQVPAAQGQLKQAPGAFHIVAKGILRYSR
jgi:hypothetical protein